MRPIILFIFPALILAQDLQTRLVFHPTVDLYGNWFAAGWGIGNFRTQTPNNVNLFGGIGYRGKNWWLEGMVQRQWSKPGDNLLLDFRFQKQFINRVSLYAEGAPFLNRRAFYEFVIVETPVWGKLRVGGETENVHRAGAKYSLAVGPRASYPLGNIGGFNVVASVAYRAQHPEPSALRFYLSFNRRFGKK